MNRFAGLVCIVWITASSAGCGAGLGSPCERLQSAWSDCAGDLGQQYSANGCDEFSSAATEHVLCIEEALSDHGCAVDARSALATAIEACPTIDPEESSAEDFDGDGVASGDCDPLDAAVHPGAPELCDGKDNDCDGEVDEIWFEDQDGDGYGDPTRGTSCPTELTIVPNSEDCNDGDRWVNPGRTELPYSSLDEDCDPETPDEDLDGDGFLASVDCDDDSSLTPDNMVIVSGTTEWPETSLSGVHAVDGTLHITGPGDPADLGDLCLVRSLVTEQGGSTTGLDSLRWVEQTVNYYDAGGLEGLTALTVIDGQLSPHNLGIGLEREVELPSLVRVREAYFTRNGDGIAYRAWPRAPRLSLIDTAQVSGAETPPDLAVFGNVRRMGGDGGVGLYVGSLPTLEELGGLESLEVVEGTVNISSNPLLTDLSALSSLREVTGDLRIEGNANLPQAEIDSLLERLGPDGVGGDIIIQANGP